MAIAIEGEKNTKGWIQIAVIAVTALFLIFGMYSLFFKSPPLVEVLIPQELETISRYSEININPRAITESTLYSSLIQHVSEPVVEGFGRENPFSRF